MFNYRQHLGLPLVAHHSFQLSGKKYLVGSNGVAALELLVEIVHLFAESPRRRGTLVRTLARRMIELDAKAVLAYVIEHAANPTMQAAAICLRSHCGGYVGTTSIAKFSKDPNVRVRRIATLALRRLHAWAQLREIAEHDPNEQIRRIATVVPKRTYLDRLRTYAKHVKPRSSRYVPGSLIVNPDTLTTAGKPAKSVAFIRSVLERIHRFSLQRK